MFAYIGDPRPIGGKRQVLPNILPWETMEDYSIYYGARGYIEPQCTEYNNFTVKDNGVTFYQTKNPEYQNNEQGKTYYYYAIGI